MLKEPRKQGEHPNFESDKDIKDIDDDWPSEILNEEPKEKPKETPIEKVDEEIEEKVAKPKEAKKENKNWWDSLVPEEIIDLLPIMTNSKGDKERIQLPIHPSSVRIATQIREQNGEKFKINLDVYKSWFYAGRQLHDLCFLKSRASKNKHSRGYKMTKIMEALDNTIYDSIFVEELLTKLMEGYVKSGQGQFTRENILAKIEEVKLLLPEDLSTRCDIFVDEELDSPEMKMKVKDRVRQRVYRDNLKKNKVVKIY